MIKQIDFGIQIDFLVWRIQLKAIVNTLTCIILLLIWVLSIRSNMAMQILNLESREELLEI